MKGIGILLGVLVCLALGWALFFWVGQLLSSSILPLPPVVNAVLLAVLLLIGLGVVASRAPPIPVRGDDSDRGY